MSYYPLSSTGTFTSESVTEGHPDKVADAISDAVLDAMLAADPEPARVRVAVETLVKGNLCVLAGEVRGGARPDLGAVVRNVIAGVGYDDPSEPFSAGACRLVVAVEAQSDEIAHAVDADSDRELGAGDQGMMFGFACDESDELMPMPITLAHRLTRALAEARRTTCPWLRPDGKSQVTVRYESGAPVCIDTVVVSAQHVRDMALDEVRERVAALARAALPEQLLSARTRVLANPAGTFIGGGPGADAGVTGRKIIADTYGGMGRHGGGAFSGKDPSKVDRSGAYAARYIAKNIVAAGLARRCEVLLAYVIGRAEPIGVTIDTFDTGEADAARLDAAVRQIFPLTPTHIIESFDLLRPIYRSIAAYGHFGRASLPWEQTDRADALRREVRA